MMRNMNSTRGDMGEWAAKIEQLGRHTDTLNKLGKEMDRRGVDVSATIGKIEAEMEAGQALARETGEAIKARLSDRSLGEGDRAEVERLGAQFQAAGTRFSDASHRVLDKGRVACEADTGGAARAGAASRAGAGLKESLLEAGDAGEIGLALENAEARNVELQQLEADLGDLHTLFKDVATLASLQQEGLDSIESAVMEANVKVSSGVQELVKANRHQKAARKRMCCLVVTGAIVLFTVLYSLFN